MRTTLLCLVLIGCNAPEVPAAEPLVSSREDALAGPHRKQLHFSSSATGTKFETTFTLGQIPDLFIAFDDRVKHGTGAHKARFEIWSPGPALYQSTEVPFTFQAQGARVWAWLPVGGTWIEQYAMVGTWEVRVFVDDANDPAATDTFILQ